MISDNITVIIIGVIAACITALIADPVNGWQLVPDFVTVFLIIWIVAREDGRGKG